MSEEKRLIDKNDLTEGDIVRKLIAFFLPVAAGTIFQQLYNAVDGIVVSKFVGTAALAAVGGSAANIINVLVGFFVALTSGAAIIIAQLYGAKDAVGLSRASNASLALCGAISIFLTIVGLIGSPTFLVWLKTPADTMEGAITYLRIYFCGVFFSLLFNMGSGILRAVGDSKRPFYYLLICAGLNMVLDLVFVIVFRMGVAGVAWATVISQVLSAVLVVISLRKPGTAYRIDLKKIRFDKFCISKMLHVGIPAGLQNSMYSVSNMIIQVGVNTLGTATVAGWSLSGKLEGFYWSAISAAGTAVMSFVGQNYGAGRYDRIRQCVKKGLIIFCAMTVCFSVAILAVGKSAFALFTDDIEVRELAYWVCSFFVPCYILWSVNEVMSGVLRGAGDAIVPTIICGAGIAGFRVIWIIFIFPLFGNLLGLSLCYPISWVITMVGLVLRYKSGKWLKKQQHIRPEAE